MQILNGTAIWPTARLMLMLEQHAGLISPGFVEAQGGLYRCCIGAMALDPPHLAEKVSVAELGSPTHTRTWPVGCCGRGCWPTAELGAPVVRLWWTRGEVVQSQRSG